MASYQVPQFLDSGEKIFLTMNIRQLAYALTAFGICAVIFSVLNSAVPGIGLYAIIPCLPVFGLGLYLALGKFNGRDAEVFVLKLIIYLLKPRTLVFSRQPDYTDIEQKYKRYTYSELQKKYSTLSSVSKPEESDLISSSQDEFSNDKIKRIRALSEKVDKTFTNSMIEYKRAESLNKRRSQQIEKWSKVKRK